MSRICGILNNGTRILFSFQRMAVSCFPGLKPLFIWGLHLLTKHITLNCCRLASNVWAHTVHMQRESELPRSCFNWMYASMWHSTSSFLFFCFSNWLGNPWKVSHKSQVFFSFFLSFNYCLGIPEVGKRRERAHEVSLRSELKCRMASWRELQWCGLTDSPLGNVWFGLWPSSCPNQAHSLI